MREKVNIEKKVELIDAQGGVYQEWEHVCDTWAQPDDQGNLTIRFHDQVRPKQKLTTSTTIFIIGSVEEFYDGKIHLLRLRFSSARGTYARAPLEPQAIAAPEDRKERRTEKSLKTV